MSTIKELILGKIDQAQMQQFIDLIDQFIAKNSNAKDPLEIILEYNQLLLTLSKLYNSNANQFGSIPLLNSKRSQLVSFKHALTDKLLNAVIVEDFGKAFLIGDENYARNVIQTKNTLYSINTKELKGINGYMLAATRFSLNDQDTALKLKNSLLKIEVLRDSGADINALDEFGRSALFYVVIGPMLFGAAQHPGREQTTQKLLDCGANPNVRDINGKTAVDYFMLEHYPSKDAINLLRRSMNLPPITILHANKFVPEPIEKIASHTQIINYLSYPILAIANVLKNIKK